MERRQPERSVALIVLGPMALLIGVPTIVIGCIHGILREIATGVGCVAAGALVFTRFHQLALLPWSLALGLTFIHQGQSNGSRLSLIIGWLCVTYAAAGTAAIAWSAFKDALRRRSERASG